MTSKKLINLQRTLKLLHNSSKCTSIQIRKSSCWTQDKIVTSPYKTIEIPNSTLFDYVWQNLERWPERTAVVCATTGRGYTYEQGFKMCSNFAASLRKKLKIRDGDVVTMMLPNIPEFPVITLGILEAGGVISTINPAYTAHEVQRQLLMSNSKLVVTLPELAKVVKEALKQAKLDLKIIVARTNGDAAPDGTILFSELSENPHIDKDCLKEVRRSAKDLCFLPYSSGTTGLPKGVELTNRNIVANCEQISDPAQASFNETTATHQDVVMGVLPFFHIYGATVVMFHKLSQGIKVVTLEKYQPAPFFRALEKFKANLLFTATPIVLVMTSHEAATKKTFEHLDIIVNGAAPCSASDIQQFLAKAERDIDFRQGYGLTETSPVVCMPKRGSKRYSTVGPALPNTDFRIVDGALNNLGPNETGELLIRGPQVMKGYRDDPQANAESLVDGWLRTGDLAFIDEEGYVTIADRLKELIKVKGFQVPPAELEALLREHPSIDDAAVIGVPHPTNGEAPKAFVVLKEGKAAKAEEISQFVKERVAVFKRVDDIVFLDAIPKSASGKILRKDLKAKYV